MDELSEDSKIQKIEQRELQEDLKKEENYQNQHKLRGRKKGYKRTPEEIAKQQTTRKKNADMKKEQKVGGQSPTGETL